MAKRAQSKRTAAPPKPSPPSIWRIPAFRALLIACAGAIVYANSLQGAFILDDHLTIEQNPSIRQLSSLATVLAPARELPTAGRPLVNLSFALNYAVGGLAPRGYHAVNAGIHLLCGLLLFGIVRRTLRMPGLMQQFGNAAAELAFAVALLWIAHPMNAEVVNYITQRTESLMALCYLLTFYCAIRASESPHPLVWECLAIVSCALGMASKESMATAPVMLVLYDRAFVHHTFKDAITRRWRLYTGLASTWLVLAFLMSSGPRIRSTGLSSGVTVGSYLLNQSRMIVRYLRLAVWPTALVSDYGLPAPYSPADVWAPLLLVGGLSAAAVFAALRYPRAGFLALGFFVTLAPSSSVVPISTEVGAERRMYVPLVMLLILGIVGAWHLWERYRSRLDEPSHGGQMPGATWNAAVFVLAMPLAIGTALRNVDYRSPLTLSEKDLARWPTARAHHSLALALIADGRRSEAIDHLRTATDGDPRAHYSLGRELLNQGKREEGIAELETFVRVQPLLLDVLSARELIGLTLMDLGRPGDAAQQFRAVLDMVPSRFTAHAELARALFAQGDYAGAIRENEAFLERQPGESAGWVNLAVAYASAGRLDDAIAAFTKATAIEPRNAIAQRNLAKALLEKQDFPRAEAAARQTIALNQRDGVAHGMLGVALAAQGKLDTALTEMRTAYALEPNDPDIQQNLRAVIELGAGRAGR